MTLHEVVNQVYALSVAGYINREKFTKKRLFDYCKSLLRDGTHNAIPNSVALEIALPDGWWFMLVQRWPRGNGYDYYIPDTREQEKVIKEKLGFKEA